MTCVSLARKSLTDPLYSLSITSSDYYLFTFLQNSLNKIELNSLENGKRHIEQFFPEKDKMLEDRITELCM